RRGKARTRLARHLASLRIISFYAGRDILRHAGGLVGGGINARCAQRLLKAGNGALLVRCIYLVDCTVWSFDFEDSHYCFRLILTPPMSCQPSPDAPGGG